MSRSSRWSWWLSADGQMRRTAAAAAMVGEVMAIWKRRSRSQPAGHGDAVLAGDLGEEPAGDAGLGFQLPEALACGDVLAVEELAGQGAAGVLPPLPCRGRGGPAPQPRGPGEVVEREPA